MVTVNQVLAFDPVNKVGQVSLQAALARDAWGGSVVSNVRPGYAGPRTDFDYASAKYRSVVPYIERLR